MTIVDDYTDIVISALNYYETGIKNGTIKKHTIEQLVPVRLAVDAMKGLNVPAIINTLGIVMAQKGKER